jgi:hypothetical protein
VFQVISLKFPVTGVPPPIFKENKPKLLVVAVCVSVY